MLDTFDHQVALPHAAEIAASKRPLPEIINIAAMIEREAEIDADRPLIASVIYNRLKKKMKLEIDATVQYARGQHVSRLLYSDLAVDSPFNTYKIAGLPPGPICNPGPAEHSGRSATRDHRVPVLCRTPARGPPFRQDIRGASKKISPLCAPRTAAAAKTRPVTVSGENPVHAR